MSVYVLHNEVLASNQFGQAEELHNFPDADAAAAHITQNLKLPLAHRLSERRKAALSNRWPQGLIPVELKKLSDLSDPDDILAPNTQVQFRSLLQAHSMAYSSWWKRHWNSHFYASPNHTGAKITLSNEHQSIVYIGDLASNPSGGVNFDEEISSIDVGFMVFMVVCAEQKNFRGDWLVCFFDKPDLSKHKRDNGQTWNDCVSSIGAATISFDAWREIIAIVFGSE